MYLKNITPKQQENHPDAKNILMSAGNAEARFLFLTTLFVSFIFLILPLIDIIVSGWFADSKGHFFLRENQYLLALRDLNRTLPVFIVPALITGLLLQMVANKPWLPAPHRLLYVLAVYGIGAFLVVHGLKYMVGRARPDAIIEFGGTLLFSPAWQITSACQNNCSFPSGEAASAMAMLAIPMMLVSVYRMPLLVLTGILALVISLNRIVMGAHFLSDVVLSWLFVATTMACLWPVFQRYAVPIDARFMQFGESLRKRAK